MYSPYKIRLWTEYVYTVREVEREEEKRVIWKLSFQHNRSQLISLLDFIHGKRFRLSLNGEAFLLWSNLCAPRFGSRAWTTVYMKFRWKTWAHRDLLHFIAHNLAYDLCIYFYVRDYIQNKRKASLFFEWTMFPISFFLVFFFTIDLNGLLRSFR